MAERKTEKPTEKKKRDAARKGQTFKAKDLMITCLTLAGVEVVLHFISLNALSDILSHIVTLHYDYSMHSYIVLCFLSGLKILLPFIVCCILASCIPGILQTGMRLATKIFRLNFSALNPVKGIKKIFNLRSLKELIKALLYLCCFVLAIKIFWDQNSRLILSLIYSEPAALFRAWGKLLHSLIMIFIGCILIIIILDCIAEYFLYIRDIKMDKKEVEREMKEHEGNPEIKRRRRWLHQELLSEETRTNVRKSNMVIVNPEHIAIGIYLNAQIVAIPFISVMEKDASALAVRRYAKKIGVPIVEDIKMAREIYKTHKINTFISIEMFREVMELLVWLGQVERNANDENNSDKKTTDDEKDLSE